MRFFRFLLFPIAVLYGIVVLIRNLLYDIGILPSKKFNIPIISIGNLSVGGTGKSPMTEYLIRLLHSEFHPAVISRGYKRHSSGFFIAKQDSTSFDVGDEPLQFKKKFPHTIVSVDENRRHGIEKLISTYPDLKVVLMDDAFQHRKVEAGLNILLTEYNRMYYNDYILPVGYLREWRSAKKRADIIVVTKCPDNMQPVEKRIITKKVNCSSHQQLFFSHTKYNNPIPVFPAVSTNQDLAQKGKWDTIILFTGISSPRVFKKYLQTKANNVISIFYPDHHEYTLVEINKLVEVFKGVKGENKIILTTEKDAMRLDKKGIVEILDKLPIYYIPIEMTFDEHEKKVFDDFVIEFIHRLNKQHKLVR